MITDCGIGLGQSSLKNIINGMTTSSTVEKVQPLPLPFVHSKVSVLCLGNITDDNGFKYGEFDDCDDDLMITGSFFLIF